ncbi:Protein YIPF5 [Orchesella cincta]|uniref:Protein YIPF5 n=1 Tax=Orchesella cincta TaxID=48709 RepID=A0A1D2NC38_ORCCI|nr:Protein YIPF5 [Orchesella cincta]
MAGMGSRKGASPSFYSSPPGGGGGSGYAGEFSSYSFGGGEADLSVSEQNFESFDYANQAPQPSGDAGYYDPAKSAPQYFVPTVPPTGAAASEFESNFEDEPPLLEELGINPNHIIEKTRSVLNPLRTTDAAILQDTDLAGPIVFCVMFGFILLLSGKVQFGYIYGIGLIGCVGMYFLLNMMSVSGVSLGVIVSVLGYCLLPMVGLAGVNLLLSLQGIIGTVLTALAVLWCSLSASKLFVTALAMQHQQTLVAYPCALVYGVFALLAVF